MKKFPTPLYRNFRSQKTKHFPNLFQKNVLTPLPHVFEPKTEALFQKSFLLLYSSIYPEDLNPFFGIVALLLLPGHLRAKTEYQVRKKHKKIAPASFSEADAISFRVFSCRSGRSGRSLRLGCGCCSSVRPIPFDSQLSAFR